MVDDLVKRLREVKDWWREPGRTAEQAADRIEQLESALIRIWDWHPINVSRPHETIDAIRDFAFTIIKGKKDE